MSDEVDKKEPLVSWQEMSSAEVKTQLIAPLVHMNGSGERLLLAQLRTAFMALDGAIDAVKQTAPHGRDYYPLESRGSIKTGPYGPVYQQAREQFEARMAKLVQVLEELAKLAEMVQKGETGTEVL